MVTYHVDGAEEKAVEEASLRGLNEDVPLRLAEVARRKNVVTTYSKCSQHDEAEAIGPEELHHDLNVHVQVQLADGGRRKNVVDLN